MDFSRSESGTSVTPVVPLERPYLEERNMTRNSSTKSLRTASLRAFPGEVRFDLGGDVKEAIPFSEPRMEGGYDDVMGDVLTETSSVSDASTASTSRRNSGGRLSSRPSFLRRSINAFSRRQSQNEDLTGEFIMTFHSKFSIVKAQEVVIEILDNMGQRFTQEKRDVTLKCTVPGRSQFKPLQVFISFIFDIGGTEITIYCPKVYRDESMRNAFVNFYKVILVELRSRSSNAVRP